MKLINALVIKIKIKKMVKLKNHRDKKLKKIKSLQTYFINLILVLYCTI